MEKKLKKPKPFFDHWKNVVLEKVWTHLEKRNSYNVNSVLTKNCVKKELEELQRKYVFAPTDKAAKNVTIICKKFYVSLIDKEINSKNFQKEDVSPEEVIKKHSTFLSSVSIQMDEENRNLPFLYCTVKQHKNPIGFRYITAGYNSSLKQLSVLVGICLKSMLHSAKNYSNFLSIGIDSITVMIFMLLMDMMRYWNFFILVILYIKDAKIYQPLISVHCTHLFHMTS